VGRYLDPIKPGGRALPQAMEPLVHNVFYLIGVIVVVLLIIGFVF
jgi:hypothetical protein